MGRSRKGNKIKRKPIFKLDVAVDEADGVYPCDGAAELQPCLADQAMSVLTSERRSPPVRWGRVRMWCVDVVKAPRRVTGDVRVGDVLLGECE